MTWRVARALEVLLGEINASAPNRSTASDGSIGDAAHASRDSDHNPWVIFQGIGIVRARDFTHDPAGGFDSYRFAEWLKHMAETVGHPAMQAGAYVISNRRIWSWDRRSEGWRTYTGSNPHDHHVHVSVALAQPGYDSTKPWGVGDGAPAHGEDDDMQLTDDVYLSGGKAVTVRELLQQLDRFMARSDKREAATLRAVHDLDAEVAKIKDPATRDHVHKIMRRLAEQLAADPA